MKKKKVENQCQCDGSFARISGLVMTLVGGLGLVLTFISKGVNKASYLHTEIQGVRMNSSAFESEMNLEVIMMLSLSVALIIAGIITFVASRKISGNQIGE